MKLNTMQSTILLVEDNPQILMSTSLLLKFNDYEIVTAENGQEALTVLNNLKSPPDLIISDIMMPEMDGYDFFNYVSKNPSWTDIPFIFLTAKATPEDVRFGKTLGVNDYITKPFDGEDLLASIEGKISRNRRLKQFSKRIEEKLIEELKIETSPSCTENDQDEIYLLEVRWDETHGPKLRRYYPNSKTNLPAYDLKEIGSQLFQSTVSLYGYSELKEADGILLRTFNINCRSYIFFDSLEDSEVRGGKRQYMLAVIAPQINYLESLRLREILTGCSDKIKNGDNWNIEDSWRQILEVLTTSSI
jgi:CheY-like chemotaxis protein